MAVTSMYLNFAKEICFYWLFIPFFFFFNGTNKDKPNGNRKKSANKNERAKLKNKSSINKVELANNNDENLENKLSTNIKSLIREKNINQNNNSNI